MLDSHAHVNDSQFDTDRADILTQAQAVGVNGWIEIGTTVADSQQAIALAKQSYSIWATVGVHPDYIADITDQDWQQLEQLVQQPKVVAVGEVGLDYYRGGKLTDQQPVLERFIALAVEYKKPVVFHVRSGKHDAHADLIHILEALPATQRPRGVIHTFSGTVDQAQAYLALGLYLSISGVITFKNAGDLVEVVRNTPLEKLLLETDCPYLTPEPHRGQRNEPAYVSFIAQKVAELKGVPVSQVDHMTETTTRQLFSL